MPRKARYNIQPQDLETPCTQCGYPIPPNEIARLGFHTMRCPRCLAIFEPVAKGDWSQLGLNAFADEAK
jgi:Zn finger protein HypA/HybF involved in hydrogenase expression